MGLFSSIGKMFNDVTGVTSSAKLNNQYQKEFAQNAHQWETEDLKKSGLNPILSAGGSGATASGGGSAGTGSMGLTDVANSAAGIAKTISDMNLQENTEKLQSSQSKLNEIEAANAAKQGGWIDKKAQTEISEAYSRMAINTAKKAETQETTKRIKGGKIAEFTGTGDSKGEGKKNLDRIYNTAKKAADYMTPLGWIKQGYKHLKG